ncbi:uncharacterized protein ALTATR162_LOCUS2274 [Alternaria atra]|uniref:Uncharacterized protein n=1 Tax=Alternaria atra TaxID=119953 RepID=A0A8J2HY28_9PLEO|nr:uncharacterized protein ALTATR162_LOCUS2274 [Alternaria atra]CAG5148955.1 unnamed protein product [Alternaria atra]
MATTNHSAQFQEPPVNGLPGATSTTPSHVDVDGPSRDDIDLQFQEPIAREASTSTSTSVSPNDDDTSLQKTTSEKLKDAVKKPFSSSAESPNSHTLGNKDITSPEMAAANEVLAAKDLKSP